MEAWRPGSPAQGPNQRSSTTTSVSTPHQTQQGTLPASGAWPSPGSSGGLHPGDAAGAAAAAADDDGDDDYGYGGAPSRVSAQWLQKVKALEAATLARQRQEKQQQALRQQASPHTQQPLPHLPPQPQHQQHHHQQQEWRADAEMEDASAEAVLQALSQLRGDQEYLDELHRAIDMDWEATAAAPTASPGLVQHPEAAVAAAAGRCTPAIAAAAAGGACSAVDLPALAARRGSAAAGAADAAPGGGSSGVQPQQGAAVVLVLDTNVLLEKTLLRFLQGLQTLQQQQGGSLQLVLAPAGLQQAGSSSGAGGSMGPAAVLQVQVVVPWMVLVELDKLKLRAGSIASSARAAVEALRSQLVGHAQDGSSSGMFAVQNLQELRQAALDFDFGVPASSLVGDDSILQCALSQLRQQRQRQEQLVGRGAPAWSQSGVLLLSNDKVMQLKARANGMPVAGMQDLPPLELPAPDLPAPAAELALQHLPACLARMLQLAHISPPWLQAAAAAAGASTCQHGAFQLAAHPLSRGAAEQHSHPGASQQGAGTAAFSPAPGARSASQHSSSLSGHASPLGSHPTEWRALQEQPGQQQSPVAASELRAAACSFLTFLRLSLSQQVADWFRADLEECWLDVLLHRPPWSDLQLVEVLLHHWNSTLKAHLTPAARHKAGHTRTVLQYLATVAKRLERHSFKGSALSQLPSNLGVRVMEVLSVLGAEQAAQQVEAALAAATAAADACHTTGQSAAAVPNMHDAVAALQAAADAAAGAAQAEAEAATASSAVAEASHDMQADHMQQNQRQQVLSFHSSADSTTHVLAAAAAAVAAPQPVGPCLVLSQLLLYAVLLLQQVLPILGQMLSRAGHAPAEAGAITVAVEQRLRAVVQQLEGLGQQIGLQQQHGLHAGILQVGLQLVDLIGLLLNDDAARAAVSQQLVLHANEFVAEATGYLTQSQQWQGHGEHPSPAAMLQQLTQALQHVQQLSRVMM